MGGECERHLRRRKESGGRKTINLLAFGNPVGQFINI
jgi:hypothetical protein